MSSFACLLFETISETAGFNGGFGAIGFIIGLIIGFFVAFILLWICLFRTKFRRHEFHYPICFEWLYCCQSCEGMCKCCNKKTESMTSLQDAEKNNDGYNSSSSSSSSSSDSDDSMKKKKKKLKKLESKVAEMTGKNKEDDNNNEWMKVTWKLSKVDMGTDTGTDMPLIDAISQVTPYEGERELLKQDFGATVKMEEMLWQNRVLGLSGICRLYLNKLVKDKVLDDNVKDQLSAEQFTRIKDLKDKLDDEFKNRFNKINEDKKSSPAQKEVHLQDLSIWYSNKLNDSLSDEVDRFQSELKRTHSLKEADLEELMTKLKGDVALLESKLAEQRIKQCANLEEVLARRRQQLAEQKLADEEIAYEIEGRIVSRQRQFSSLVQDKELSENDKMALLNTYRRNLCKEKEAFEKSMLIQKEELKKKLLEHRRRQMADAERKALNNKSTLVNKADTFSSGEEFVTRFDEELDKDRQRSTEVLDVLDRKDCDQLMLVRRDLQRDKEANERRVEDELGVGLAKAARKDEAEVGRLLDLHNSQMLEFKKHKSNERRQHLLKLEEKLAKRQAEFTNTMETRESDLLNVKKQQEIVLKKAMTFQIDMDDNAKEKILQEHERNMMSMNNQLQLSRLKQEKNLEQKLAERKARISVLKKEQRDRRLELDEQRVKDGERIDQDYQKKIQTERDAMLTESRQGRQQLRDVLAKETEEALRNQEAHLHAIIGKLQVGQARRKHVIDKQEKLIDELESELEKRLSGDNANLSTVGLDQILQNHFNQVDNLQGQLQNSKKKQELRLTEKLEQKKLQKQHAVGDAVKHEGEVVKGALEQSGHGINRSVAVMVLETALDLKYKNGIQELEEEINLEFTKQQEDLDREMEEELQHALQEQRKKLFTQLANLTDISSKEINTLVEKAGAASGANAKLTKRMSKDLLGNAQRLKNEDRDFDSFPRPASSKRPTSSRPIRNSRHEPDGRSSDDDYNN